MKGIDAGTIARTICLALALLNQGLTIAGYSPLPIEDAQVNQLMSLLFTMGASLWAWWKNNSFTQAAREGDNVMRRLKAKQHT